MAVASKGEQNVTVTISTGTIVRVILLVLGVAALFALQQLVLILLTSIVIASSLEPGVLWLRAKGVPRVLSVLSVYLAIFGMFFGTLFIFVPPILDDMSAFLGRIPSLLDSIETNQNPLINIPLFEGGGESGTQSARDAIASFRGSFSTAPEGFLRTVSAIFGGLLSFVLVIVFSFYFAVQEKGIEEFLRLVAPRKYEEHVIDLWYRSERKIGLWMQGQLMLAILLGVFVYLGLTIIGVPYALLLGVIAAMFEVIPVFGPVLAALPGVALAFVDGGLSLGIVVVIFYIVIQQFESHLLSPIVVSKVIGVPPILVILSLVIGAELFGFMGVILAVPVAAVIQELVTDVKKSRAALSKALKDA